MFKKICFILTSLLVPVAAFAICEQCKPNDKIYVQFNDLIFDSNGIWFKSGGNLEKTEALFVDSLGYYVAEKKKEDKPKVEPWICPHCGMLNTESVAWGCCRCGWPFNDDFFRK